MVWDVGTWEPLSPETVKGKYLPGTEATAMIAKGDLKIRLHGKRLNGDVALIHIKARRPGSKGNEWLLIKKHDDYVIEHFDIDQHDTSVLSGKTMAQIAGDEGSAEWLSSKKVSRGKVKAPWLAESLARLGKKANTTMEDTEEHRGKAKKQLAAEIDRTLAKTSPTPRANIRSKHSSVSSVPSVVKGLKG